MEEFQRPAVTDWATDFDHLDPEYNHDAYEIWKRLREGGCPVAHTDRYHGVYLPTRHEDIVAIAHDPERFSSMSVTINEVPTSRLGEFKSPPITSDPPEHQDHRRVLLPAFSPRAVQRWEPVTREICAELVAGLVERRQGCASEDYAKRVPVRVIAAMLGVPASDEEMFLNWIHALTEVGPTDLDLARRVTKEMFRYFSGHIEARRGASGDDLVSYLLGTEGGALNTLQISGTLALVLLAGIDTTWSTLASALWHLGLHGEDLTRLVNEPELMATAIEEFLRFYAPVSLGRVVTEDTELSGTVLRAGQRVLVPFPAANRDPEFMVDAETFRIDRKLNRHLAFGLGIHRCLGSNLARMEIRVALEEWLRQIPEFEIAQPDAVRWSRGQVRGPRLVPVRW